MRGLDDPKTRRRAIRFILVTILIDTIGFGIVIPVLPELIMELTGEGLSDAALYGGWLIFTYGAMQLFFAPILGNWSDRVGRRPVLLVSLLALGVDYVLMGLAPTIAWLFIGRCIAGIAGATVATANAYIADLSEEEERAANFGLIGAAWGLGFILGPVIGGLLGELGPRVPFFAAAVLALVNAAYGAIVLPESLPKSSRRRFEWSRANPIGTLRVLARVPGVVGMLGVVFLYGLAHDANPSTWTYFTMLEFDWSERDVGLSMGAIGALIAIVQGGLIRIAIPRLGERNAALLGLAMMALGFAGFAFATAGWMMYAFMLPLSLMGLAMPAIRSILAGRVPENAQGELQGGITSLMSLTAVLAPLLNTRLFHFFTSEAAPIYFPGASFLTAATLTTVAMLLFATTVRATHLRPATAT